MKCEYVKDWMSENVMTISPQTKLPEAHRLMVNEEIRRLPVVDENGTIPFLVEMAIDITESAQMKKEHQLLFDQVLVLDLLVLLM